MPVRTGVDVQGVGDLIHALEGLTGRELEKTTRDVFKAVGQTVIAPAVKAAINPKGYHNRSKKPVRRGQGGPLKRNVTSRALRPRRGETAAITTGPRAWYKHFFFQGTAKHVISATDAAGDKATKGHIRTINKLEAGAYWSDEAKGLALLVSGRFYARVNHPGGPPHDQLAGVAASVTPKVTAALTDALMRKVAARTRASSARSAARRARP